MKQIEATPQRPFFSVCYQYKHNPWTLNLNELAAAHGLPVPETFGGPRCFRIIRFRRGAKSRTIKSNLTETEAQAHCSREDTHGLGWFDGYDYMKGCRP